MHRICIQMAMQTITSKLNTKCQCQWCNHIGIHHIIHCGISINGLFLFNFCIQNVYFVGHFHRKHVNELIIKIVPKVFELFRWNYVKRICNSLFRFIKLRLFVSMFCLQSLTQLSGQFNRILNVIQSQWNWMVCKVDIFIWSRAHGHGPECNVL